MPAGRRNACAGEAPAAFPNDTFYSLVVRRAPAALSRLQARGAIAPQWEEVRDFYGSARIAWWNGRCRLHCGRTACRPTPGITGTALGKPWREGNRPDSPAAGTG